MRQQRVALGASGSRHLDLDRQHLAARFALAHALRPAPLGGHDAERPPVVAAEHAREAAAVDVDRLEHLAALAHAHAAAVRHVGVPDRAGLVEADAVRRRPYDSATIRVASSGVIAMPFGNMPPRTTSRASPSGVTSAIAPGAGAPPPI